MSAEEPITKDELVAELRAAAIAYREQKPMLRGYDGASAGMATRAADEIERLRRKADEWEHLAFGWKDISDRQVHEIESLRDQVARLAQEVETLQERFA